MVPALIIAALAALLLCAATSYAHIPEDQFTLGSRGMTTTFISALASMSIGSSSASARTPLGGRKARLVDQFHEVVFTSINVCKFPSGHRAASRWLQPIALAEDSIRPTG